MLMFLTLSKLLAAPTSTGQHVTRPRTTADIPFCIPVQRRRVVVFQDAAFWLVIFGTGRRHTVFRHLRVLRIFPARERLRCVRLVPCTGLRACAAFSQPPIGRFFITQ